ncbi:MAG: selenocysteine-specific translation elongation factor [Lachnospiraceae bacterium]|nr:selenocysteine-specific translation elongation factor [Lachnospiraceae bacterium]
MKNIIVGTAGHIDHGKTSLIKALTGYDADRLAEEKRRGITIELGFTHFDLPSGTRIGIIDVPGHEKFVGNMVTGVVGMDLVLILIAADEGIMPQTREHIAILEQLGVQNAILVLSKCDMVDEEWAAMMQEEVRQELKKTMYANSPMVCVSSVTGQGIPELVRMIDEMTEQTPERDISEIPRLPIDRVFTLSGFGTIVTGTLISGVLNKETQLALYPGDLPCKIRNIQVHDQDVEQAYAGQRVAINLTGVKKEEIHRGDVLAPPGSMQNTDRLDVKIRMLELTERTIKNRSRLHLCIGTTQVLCRAVLLGTDELLPGQEGYAQLLLEEPIAVRKKDRFILRFYSPLETIAGGEVLDQLAVKKRRMSEATLEEMRQKEKGGAGDILEYMVKEAEKAMITVKQVADKGAFPAEELEPAIAKLVEGRRIVELSVRKERYLLHCFWEMELLEDVEIMLNEFHEIYKYRRGMFKSELHNKLLPSAKQAVFDQLLSHWEEEEKIKVELECVNMADFRLRKDRNYQKMEKWILKNLREAGFNFLRFPEITFMEDQEQYKEDVLQNMVFEQKVVKVYENIYTLPQYLEEAKEKVIPILKSEGKITISGVRDLRNTSRKNVTPLLEYFDSIHLTRKNGTESERESAI